MQPYNIRTHKLSFQPIISKIYQPKFFDYIHDYFFLEIAVIIIVIWLYVWFTGDFGYGIHILPLLAVNLIFVQLLRRNKH
jgi:hypothetical protein